MQHNFPEALTFDDVLLRPAKSEFHPTEVDTSTLLTRNGIRLSIPLVSAAMDKVTESIFAVAIAQLGGIGIIHINMSIEEQTEQVDRVKRSESGMISNPVTITPERPIAEVMQLMEKFHISGIPVVDSQKNRKLIGIITNRDLQFENRHDLKVADLMTNKNLITTKVGTTLKDAEKVFRRRKVEKLPVVDKQGKLKGLITIKDLRKATNFPNATKDKQGRLRVGAALGVGGDYLDRAAALVKAGVDVLVVDTAHGHSTAVLKAIRKLKSEFPEAGLIGGNISTGEGARDLIAAGVDAVKVGQGPGSTCTTRPVTGNGVPQITAVMECAEAASKSKVPIIADGGIRFSGDIVKAIAAGASSVMIGMMFAGTDEAPGEVILYQGRTYKKFRGMGSIGAMKEGSARRYGQHGQPVYKLVPEGIEGRVASRGPLAGIVHQLVGGLRSGMGMQGAGNIKQLQKQSRRFVRVSAAGQRESHVHDVIITEEAPNYSLT
ncbi:MAG: IMP dehydrogenase [Candidatus Doudnabacteria bacterium]|nr:IMP dehydrogenase [Candidatus Doudnabacteria bacterium]